MTPNPGIKIGRVFGIPIYLHASWFIMFALVTYLLATQFGALHPQWTPQQHWMVGILTSVLFFVSVLLHELSHSVVALHYKLPVTSITLFVFGGLSRMSRDADTALQEFNIAAAGPLSSFVIAGIFWSLTRIFPQSQMMGALAGWLAQINFLLAAFNLVPGFPLDGGRLLRAIVWSVTKNFNLATRFASRSGQFIAYTLIIGGIVWAFERHDFLNGLWAAFIGWFLLTAAQASYAQVAIHDALAGLHAADIMNHDLPVVSRSISLEDYGHEVLRTGRRGHLVMEGDRLVGLMTVHALNHVPREDWNVTSVQAVMLPREKIQSARPDEPALALLERMQAADINQMPVVEEDGRVTGMVSRASLLSAVKTRVELGQLVRQ
jgi:Zn-dependent protease/predicted transcriptional regulator